MHVTSAAGCPKIGREICRTWNELFSDRDDKKLLALKIVVVREKLVRDDIDGWPCAKKERLSTETMWTYACFAGQKRPPDDIHPPTLRQLLA